MKRRRCLFPADGFYEWKREGERKQPYFVRLKSGEPMAFAGLWESWMRAERRGAGDCRDRHHDGEPLDRAYPRPHAGDRAAGGVRLLARSERGCARRRSAVIAPAPDAALEAYEVSSAVNRTANDSPKLLEPLREPEMVEAAPAAPKRAKKSAEGRRADDRCSDRDSDHGVIGRPSSHFA